MSLRWLSVLGICALLLGPAVGQPPPRTIRHTEPEPPLMIDPWKMMNSIQSGDTNAVIKEAGNALPPDLRQLLDQNGMWPFLFEGQGQAINGVFFPSPWLLGGQKRTTDWKPRSLGGQPVDRYTVMQINGNPCRVPADALPIKVFTPTAPYRPVAQQAMDLWNRVGEQMPQPRTFFVQVTTPEEAQLVVDWMGEGLPPRAAAVTDFGMWTDHVVVRGIKLKDVAKADPGEVSETLAHELGHVLGLDHSENPKDLMYISQPHIFTKPTSRVSQRDNWMLSWLYSQQSAVPVRPLPPKPALPEGKPAL